MKYIHQNVQEQLDLFLNKRMAEFIRIASEVLKRDVHVNLSHDDKLRLLILYSWSNKYKLSVEEILTVLLKVWDGKFSRNRKGLGIALSTLTGQKAKEILLDYIVKVYPARENLKRHKEQLKFEILPETPIEEWEDPVEFILGYRERIQKLQLADREVAEKYARRKFRDNPFI